jgi:hypothetical protein
MQPATAMKRFSGPCRLELETKALDLTCVLNVSHFGTLPQYDGKLEGFPYFDARRACRSKKPLKLTLADGRKFDIVTKSDGTFTAFLLVSDPKSRFLS